MGRMVRLSSSLLRRENGKYVASEKPLNIQTAVSLEHEVQYDGGNASESNTAP